jgi:hypothetical protein
MISPTPMIANLLLEITRRILGIGSANAGADYRTRCRSDAGSAATANRRTERCPKTSTKNSTADSLGIGLIAQRGDLRRQIAGTPDRHNTIAPSRRC